MVYLTSFVPCHLCVATWTGCDENPELGRLLVNLEQLQQDILETSHRSFPGARVLSLPSTPSSPHPPFPLSTTLRGCRRSQAFCYHNSNAHSLAPSRPRKQTHSVRRNEELEMCLLQGQKYNDGANDGGAIHVQQHAGFCVHLILEQQGSADQTSGFQLPGDNHTIR